MLLKNVGTFLFDGSLSIMPTDSLANQFIEEFEKQFQVDEKIFETISDASYLSNLATFIKFCTDSQLIPNKYAITIYLNELKLLIASKPDFLHKPLEKFSYTRNESISYEDYNSEFKAKNRPTIEEIKKVVKIKATVKSSPTIHALPTMEKTLQAESAWRKVTTEVKRSNRKYIKEHPNLRDEIIANMFSSPSANIKDINVDINLSSTEGTEIDPQNDAEYIDPRFSFAENDFEDERLVDNNDTCISSIPLPKEEKLATTISNEKYLNKAHYEILDFVIQMMQRHSTITCIFPPDFLTEEKFTHYRLRQMAELGNPAGRKNMEDKLLADTQVSFSTRKSIQENVISRPRYARLDLFAAGDPPTTLKDGSYGVAYVVLNEKIKLQATYTKMDTMTSLGKNWRLSTLTDLEVLLHEMVLHKDSAFDKSNPKSLMSWALEGKAIDFGYVEAQIPLINILDSEQITNIYIPTPDSNDSNNMKLGLKVSANVIESFAEINIKLDNIPKNPGFIISKEFFELISDNEAKLSDIKVLLHDYPYLPKMRTTDNETVFELVARSGHVDVLDMLISAVMGGAPQSESDITIYDRTMLGRMIYEATKSDNKVIRDHLISLAPNIVNYLQVYFNKETNQAMVVTPLIRAVIEKDLSTFKSLLNLDADPKIPDAHDKSTIDYLNENPNNDLFNFYYDFISANELKSANLLNKLSIFSKQEKTLSGPTSESNTDKNNLNDPKPS